MTTPGDGSEYWLLDRNGVPAALIDADKIQHEGNLLAFRLAVASPKGGDEAYDVLVEAVRTLDVETQHYVLTAALRILCEAIVGPMLMTADQLGLPIMPAIRQSLADLENKTSS